MPVATHDTPTPWLVGPAAHPAVDLDAGLVPWIDDADLVAGTGHHTLVQAPDVATTLVVRTDPQGRTELVVVGPRTRGTYHPAERASTCIRFRVRAGRTRALLGAPVSELADRTTPVADLWGALGRRVADEVAGGLPARRVADEVAGGFPARRVADESASGFSDWRPHGQRAGAATRLHLPGPDVLRAVAGALRERARSAPGDPAEARLVGAALRALAPESGPAPRLGVVADRLGISERHLRTIFAREVGLSPKHYARIARMRRVLAMAGTRQWAHVAGETGFFDQAHLITDFRALMGVSPGAYLAGHLPAPSPCARTAALRNAEAG
jgi:AraC-like DNA-binding protein